MPISVRFRLRSPKVGEVHRNPHPIQCIISIDGVEDKGFGAVWPLDGTGEKIQVDPARWKVKMQATNLRTDPANDMIQALKAHVLSIYRSQKLTGKPDLKSVRHELTHQKPPLWSDTLGWQYGAVVPAPALATSYFASRLTENDSLLTAYQTYVAGLRAKQAGPGGQSSITIGRWDYGLRLLELFQAQTGEPLPAVGRLTVGWAKRYHAWLQVIGENDQKIVATSLAQAGRFLNKIGEVLSWMLEEGWVVSNPIAQIKWPRPAEKEVQFLEPRHVHQLMCTEWKDTEADALWWFVFMCCTGLDYPDAIAYARNPAAFNQKGPGGWKIVGRRAKPPHVGFDVPLLDEVKLMLQLRPGGPHDITPQCVNRKTRLIEQVLGITWRITAKTARKTYGCLMLAAGYSMSEVSRMLGHSNVTTTQKYYVKVTGNTVDRAMLRNTAMTIGQLVQLDQAR